MRKIKITTTKKIFPKGIFDRIKSAKEAEDLSMGKSIDKFKLEKIRITIERLKLLIDDYINMKI